MWPTTDGYRTLGGIEADWFRRCAGVMVDHLVAEGRDSTEQQIYDVDGFDVWDWRQRLWLLRKVIVPMLTNVQATDAAAIFEATIEAVFCEAGQLIALEIEGLTAKPVARSWREAATAVAQHHRLRVPLPGQQDDIEAWTQCLLRIREGIFGPLHYLNAEPHRDTDFARTQHHLMRRGLPPDFLARIPPLQTVEQTQRTIDRLQSLIFRAS